MGLWPPSILLSSQTGFFNCFMSLPLPKGTYNTASRVSTNLSVSLMSRKTVQMSQKVLSLLIYMTFIIHSKYYLISVIEPTINSCFIITNREWNFFKIMFLFLNIIFFHKMHPNSTCFPVLPGHHSVAGF